MLLRYSVALMAVLLAFGIGVHAWRQRSYGLGCLAGWVATVAVAALGLAFAVPGSHRPGLDLLITLLNTLAAPLLLSFVVHAVRGTRLHWAWFLPFAVHVVAAVVIGTPLLQQIKFTTSVMYEYGFTALAWVVYARSSATRRDLLPVLGVLVAVTTLHLAQLTQILALQGFYAMDLVRQAPFIVLVIWFAIAIGIAAAETPVVRRLVPTLAATADDEDRALFARIVRIMAEQRPWADPELEVGGLAAMLDTNPNAVSRALSRAGVTTFYAFVNLHRVREAQRLLLDPNEARVKVEALGRQAGFRSRSTFFKAFREHTGLTPSEYRAAQSAPSSAESSPSAP